MMKAKDVYAEKVAKKIESKHDHRFKLKEDDVSQPLGLDALLGGIGKVVKHSANEKIQITDMMNFNNQDKIKEFKKQETIKAKEEASNVGNALMGLFGGSGK